MPVLLPQKKGTKGVSLVRRARGPQTTMSDWSLIAGLLIKISSVNKKVHGSRRILELGWLFDKRKMSGL